MSPVLYQALEADWMVMLRCDRRREALKSRPPCTLVPQILHLPSLIATFGPDLPIEQLASCLRCPKCGSRRVTVDVARSATPRRLRAMQPAGPGEVTLGTSGEPWIVFECPRCARRGEYRRTGLLKEFGSDMRLPSLLLPFAASKGCAFARDSVARPDLTRAPECKIRYVIES